MLQLSGLFLPNRGTLEIFDALNGLYCRSWQVLLETPVILLSPGILHPLELQDSPGALAQLEPQVQPVLI